MSLLHVICFGLKVGHFFFSLCYQFYCLILLTWLNHGGILNRKIGEGKMCLKVWNQIIESLYRIRQHCFQYIGSIRVRMNWWRIALIAWLIFGFVAAISCFWFMSSMAAEKRREILASMCDERARMLQDQFNVSMNHIQSMSVMISIFHHSKNPSAIDQSTFAKYTEETSFERPLTSGVAYAVRVLHKDRDRFEAEQGWTIKRMDNFEQTPVQEDPENLETSTVQEEYGPVIFAQDTVAHVISFDVLSGKEDLENVVRARESGKGVLTAPFRLLKTNRLGVILTFAIYKRDLPPNPTVSERIEATAGYLGGIFDIESLVEKLLHQLASKQAILVNVYDTTDPFHPISMYGSVDFRNGLHHVSVVNFGDPFKKHEMHCRFQQKPPWPWVAITTSLGGLIIVLLIGHIFQATMNRIAKVEDDYQQMMELKRRAEDADIAKSQFLATVSHEIRTPMNGVLGMLQMLRDTKLDDTQEDYVRTAGESGKALVSLINEVLDQAKIESGKLELEAVTFNLRTILDDVLSLFSGKYQGNNVEIAVYVSNKVPATLVGDPGRFRQIVMNLVGNSIKFTEKGHVFVTVHLVEEVAELESEVESTGSLSGRSVIDRRKSWAGFRVFNQETQVSSSSSCLQSLADQVKIIVSVEDTGQGIPLEAQSKVFNPFMQVGPSITRTHGGTGIGLSISKYLVHLMKGEIGLASLPQVGSTFTFTAFFTNGCPDYTGHETGDQLNSSFPEFSGMRALLLDTNPIRAKVSKYHIERLGIKVEVLRDSNSSLSTPVDMFFMEEETLDNDSCFLLMLLQKLRNNQKVKPKFLVLTNSTCSTRATSDGDPLFVVIKPLRASMLASYLHRAMGVGNRGNSELKTQPLTSLLSGRRILVVDDNPVNLKVAAGALKKYGAEVVHAESGKDAVSLLTPPHRFNACFMDVQMPEMDGFQATRRIREVESSFNNGIQTGEPSQQDHGNTITSWRVPILAMTADVIQATNEKCSKYGMDGYVSKPFEAEQLYREVSRFFQTSDGNQ